MRDNKFALLLFLVALLQGLLWALISPPWQHPDESSHFAYVQNLCEGGTVSVNGQRVSREVAGALGALKHDKIGWKPFSAFSFTPEEKRAAQETLRAMPRSARTDSSGLVNPAGHYPPLYYRVACLGYRLFHERSILSRLLGVRMVSVLLSALTVLVFYFMARSFFTGDPTSARAAACLLLFHPMHAYMGAAVSCDVLLFFVSAVLLMTCLKIVRDGLSPASLALLCLFMALGLLTKPTFVAMVPVCGLAVIMALKRPAAPWRKMARNPLVIIGALAGAVLLFVIIRSGYLVSWINIFLAAGSGESGSFLTYLGNTAVKLFMPWTLMAKRLISSYWANFGAMDTMFSFYGFYILAHAALLFSLGYGLVRIHRSPEPRHAPRKGALLFTVYGSLLFVAGVLVIGFAVSDERWGGGTVQGRYLFPALYLNLLIIPYALVHSIRSERRKRWIAFAVVGAMMTWHMASYVLVFERYYL